MGADLYASNSVKTAEELAAEAAAFLASREPATEITAPPASATLPVETKTYTDGTVATGTGPLPELSPAQQDAKDASPSKTASGQLEGLRNLIGVMVQEELVRVQSGCHYGAPTADELSWCGQFHDLLTHGAMQPR